jgi:uncharacterized protein YdiU (UPF0061 family)
LQRKLGFSNEREGDAALGQDLLKLMHDHRADFTNSFRALSDAATGDDSRLHALFGDDSDFAGWLRHWRERLAQEPTDSETRQAAMRAVNPAYIPRNHRVEAMIRAAVENDDFEPFEELLALLSNPYEEQCGFEHYTAPPQEHERVQATFCGT